MMRETGPIPQWIIAAFLLLFLLRPARAQQTLPAVTRALSIQGTSYTSYADGKKIWEIHAAAMKGNAKRVKATRIRGTLYRNEKPVYYMKAPVAFLNPATNNILFPDGVTLRSTRGESVHVHVLVWEADQKRFVGSKGVEVVRLNTRLQGDRMLLKQGFVNLILLGHVKVLVRP